MEDKVINMLVIKSSRNLCYNFVPQQFVLH